MTDGLVVAVRGALEPYQWRRLTPEMLVRLVLAASDAVGGLGAGVPVSRNDPRVGELVAVLAAVEWRALTIGALCRRLAEALEEWQVRDRCLDLELAWLLDESA